MHIITYLYSFLAAITVFFLVFPFLEIIFSFFRKEAPIPKEGPDNTDFGCIITAYRNIKIAEGLVQSLLKQSYKKQHIYLIADAAQKEDWTFEHEQLTVFFPDPSLNLKVKSIIYAVERYVRRHNYTVVFDADNLAHPNFLAVINQYIGAGHTAIQGQRTAKNLDNFYACADAMGEFYKNHTDRYLPYLLGASAVISGSGMAVETERYKQYLYGAEIQAGKEMWKKMLQEDKILQNDLLWKNDRIVYAMDAIVYDEKVTSADGVETQRSRWLYSYFQNIPNVMKVFGLSLKNFSWNQFLFGIVTIAPPMFIQLFAGLVLCLLGIWLQPMMAVVLAAALVLFAVNVVLTLYVSGAPKQVLDAIWKIPFFVFKQITALFKMKNPDKNFKHTEHTRNVSIEDIIGKQ